MNIDYFFEYKNPTTIRSVPAPKRGPPRSKDHERTTQKP